MDIKKDNYAHMIHGPMERSQGVVLGYEGSLLLNGHYKGELWSFETWSHEA